MNESRYEGWDEDREAGTVSRFDKQSYRWVEFDIEEIPQSVIEDRRD